MKIHHIAIWTFRLEEMKEFYTRYFKGISNEKYINPKKGFESYFLRFEGGTDLELMSRTDIRNTPIEENRRGLTHFASSAFSKPKGAKQPGLIEASERLMTIPQSSIISTNS